MVADRLRRAREAIIERWERQAAALPNARTLSREQLRDHFPEMFDRFVSRYDAIERGRPQEPAEPLPEQHAVHRLETGYRPEEVVKEFALLRETVIEELSKESPPTADELVALHREIDYALARSIARFAEVRGRSQDELIGGEQRARAIAERARRELAQSEARLRLIFDGIQDYAIVTIDPEGNISSWNAGAQRLAGYAANEIIGRPFSLLLTDEDKAGGLFEREMSVAAATGAWTGEGFRVRKDGSRLLAEVSLRTLRDEQGELLGFVKVMHDITQRREVEKERERLHRDLEEAVRTRDEFLSVTAHDVRSPLTAVRLQVQSVWRKLKQPPEALDVTWLRERVERMDRQLERVTALLDNLLDLQRMQSGQISLERERLDLGQLTREVLARFEEAFVEAGCELTVQLDSIVGDWDRLRLEQVVTNLVSNALKYGAGKPIEVTVARAGERARLVVKDHGSGIAAAEQEAIFRRFERVGDQAAHPGVGLGLWIVRLVVEALGGEVRVESTPGEGAAFVVDLPP